MAIQVVWVNLAICQKSQCVCCCRLNLLSVAGWRTGGALGGILLPHCVTVSLATLWEALRAALFLWCGVRV